MRQRNGICSRCTFDRLSISTSMLVFFLFCLVVPAPSMADCETIPLQGPRDEPQMEELVQQCKNSESESNATVASLLGYAHRHGYGVPRNISAARRYFTDALSATDCEPYAVCGLKALAARSAPNNCNVDCSALANSVDRDEKDTPERDAKSRAYQLLAELLNSDPSIQRTAEELKTALNNILTQEEQLRNEAYQELCTGHVKRAVVTISVAHQLDREINRRDRLVQHHKEKVEEDGNARSQASLMQLQEAQSRSSHDKRVFFEKYAKAVFSASNCDEEILAGSYDSFEREIAEVAVTALEQSAYRLFQQHVNDARADRGMNSTWFDNLDTLLDQQ